MDAKTVTAELQVVDEQLAKIEQRAFPEDMASR